MTLHPFFFENTSTPCIQLIEHYRRGAYVDCELFYFKLASTWTNMIDPISAWSQSAIKCLDSLILAGC